MVRASIRLAGGGAGLWRSLAAPASAKAEMHARNTNGAIVSRAQFEPIMWARGLARSGASGTASGGADADDAAADKRKRLAAIYIFPLALAAPLQAHL